MIFRACLALVLVFAASCADDDPAPQDAAGSDAAADAAADASQPDTAVTDTTGTTDTAGPADATGDATPDALTDAAPGEDADATPVEDTAPDADAGGADAGADVFVPLLPLETKSPFGLAPADPLAGTEIESCAVYQATRCEGGVTEACALFDTTTGAFVDEPDPLLRRTLLFERWYDLYQSPMGLTVDRNFSAPVPPGTPEQEWGSLERFASYGGAGDAPIWSGKALTAYALRYLRTGTTADYERMEQKVRQMLVLFDVTGIPGYLARYPFLLLEPGAPKTDQIIVRTDPAGLDGGDHVFDPTAVPDLPAAFTEGLTDGEGKVWTGPAYWHGNPSIDQYSGFTTSMTIVWDLLQDEELKSRVAHHLTCYLKRLSRIEIRNLQSNPEALEAVNGFFGGAAVQLDPGDLDITKTDTIVAYVLLQPNSLNTDTFDPSCPATVALEPARIIDAVGPTFLLDLAGLANDMQSHKYASVSQIDHFYVPSVRGGDAMQLMNLATLAYRFTGDEMYREFLSKELVGSIGTIDVAHIMSAFEAPKWCNSFFGAHITYTPLWTFIEQLADSDLRTHMQQVMAEEMWAKEVAGRRNAELQLMLRGAVPAAMVEDAQQVLDEALASLEALGGNGGVLDDPRRTYTLDPAWVASNMPAGITVECPTEAERQLCEAGISLFGITFESKKITAPCLGVSWECPMEGDVCVRAQASYGMPMDYRVWEDFMWQRNPFKLGVAYGTDGLTQSPGLDLIEPYWVARTYGFVTEGEGQVLAWRNVEGSACGD